MPELTYLELKLFLNLTDSEVAEVLENIEGLQHIETFKELKKKFFKIRNSKNFITLKKMTTTNHKFKKLFSQLIVIIQS